MWRCTRRTVRTIAPRSQGYSARMDSHDHQDKVGTRSVPLPEERTAADGGEDRRAEAAAVLRDSEERVAAATEAPAPGDAADEHRRSADTATD